MGGNDQGWPGMVGEMVGIAHDFKSPFLDIEIIISTFYGKKIIATKEPNSGNF